MVALLSIYEDEDESYQDLVTVATTFFQYLLQPFRDMRELACLYKMEILVNKDICLAAVADIFEGGCGVRNKAVHCFACRGPLQKSLEFEDLGPKRIEALEKEAEEWRMKAEDAVASIQDITVTYFAQTSKALAGMRRCVYFSYLCLNELMNDFLMCLCAAQKMKHSRVGQTTYL